MGREVNFQVFPGHLLRPYLVSLELERGVTCSEIVQDMLDALQLNQKGAWHLVEVWSNCERAIHSDEDVFMLNEGWARGSGSEGCARFRLRQKPSAPRQDHKILGNSLKMKQAILSNPKSFLARKITHKRLRCVKWTLKRALRQSRKKYSNLLLQRLVKRDPLWGPPAPTPMDFLKVELANHKANNLQLSTEIADLNIVSTRLRNQVHPLRQKEQSLTNQLARLQEQVSIKREEKERRGPKDLAQVQTEIIKLKRELEMRNRLNTGHTSKLKTQKQTLTEKRKILAEKQQELSTLKLKNQPPSTQKSEHHHLDNVHEIDEPDLPQLQGHKPKAAILTSPDNHNAELCTPTLSKTDHRVSSTSRKRHSSKFEAKTRQLVEEEGITFRKVQSQMKEGHLSPDQILSEDQRKLSDLSPRKKLNLDPEEDSELFSSTDLSTYQKSAIYLHTEGPDVLVIPKEDKQWYENSQDTSYSETTEHILGNKERPGDDSRGQSTKKGKPRRIQSTDEVLDQVYKQNEMSHKGQGTTRSSMKQGKRSIPGRKVQFTAAALILNAALEGDLDLLKHCVKELGSCSQTSDKGATCLHNAVCSGSMSTVEYLVEMGCDINAQDIDGWTPLHCAAAYRNIDMIRYLTDHGSSLFLATQDGDTSLRIAVEEYEIQKKTQDQEGPSEEEEEMAEPLARQVAAECLHHLMDVQTSLGVANGGRVYALFTRKSSDPQELSFNEGEPLVIIDRGSRGEQWWTAENGRRQRGQVPCTYLGAQCRHSVVL